jgi:hypothetical protein
LTFIGRLKPVLLNSLVAFHSASIRTLKNPKTRMNGPRQRSLRCETTNVLRRFVALFLISPGIVVLIGHQAMMAQTQTAKPGNWISLFDGKSLAAWHVTEFGGQGAVMARDGNLVLGMGSPLTGVTYAGGLQLPSFDYEIRLEARRVDGTDFFCGLTFPYGDSHCTLVIGGWGGGLIGLSSLADLDASENETTSYRSFKTNQWVDIRLQVRDGHIDAWIDDKQCVACAVRERKVNTRPEVIRSKPLGVASYQTRAELRSLRLRRLSPKRGD